MITTLIEIPWTATGRLGVPHHTQLMPLIDATLKCHGQVILIPQKKSGNAHACELITYIALSHLLNEGTTVIIG